MQHYCIDLLYRKAEHIRQDHCDKKKGCLRLQSETSCLHFFMGVCVICVFVTWTAKYSSSVQWVTHTDYRNANLASSHLTPLQGEEI